MDKTLTEIMSGIYTDSFASWDVRRLLKIQDIDGETLIAISKNDVYIHPDLTVSRLLLYLFRYHTPMTSEMNGQLVIDVIRALEKHQEGESDG